MDISLTDFQNDRVLQIHDIDLMMLATANSNIRRILSESTTSIRFANVQNSYGKNKGNHKSSAQSGRIAPAGIIFVNSLPR